MENPRISGMIKKRVCGNPSRPTLPPIPSAVSQINRGNSHAFIARRILRSRPTDPVRIKETA